MALSWPHAQSQILKRIHLGTNLNTSNTTYRFVRAVRGDITSQRYGYNNEKGFQVQIGNSSSIKIPLSMLQTCYSAVGTKRGYDGQFFRHHFPQQASDHPCHVHVVGQIFAMAGLAVRQGNTYR